jgi:hypothetical protein
VCITVDFPVGSPLLGKRGLDASDSEVAERDDAEEGRQPPRKRHRLADVSRSSSPAPELLPIDEQSKPAAFAKRGPDSLSIHGNGSLNASEHEVQDSGEASRGQADAVRVSIDVHTTQEAGALRETGGAGELSDEDDEAAQPLESFPSSDVQAMEQQQQNAAGVDDSAEEGNAMESAEVRKEPQGNKQPEEAGRPDPEADQTVYGIQPDEQAESDAEGAGHGENGCAGFQGHSQQGHGDPSPQPSSMPCSDKEVLAVPGQQDILQDD